MSKPWGQLRKLFWPSQKSWTLNAPPSETFGFFSDWTGHYRRVWTSYRLVEENLVSLEYTSVCLFALGLGIVVGHLRLLNLKSIFSWNSIAQNTNEIFEKILQYEANAEFCQIFQSFFGQRNFKKKYFWDLLTFRKYSKMKSLQARISRFTARACGLVPNWSNE